jgi:hypothetical protein
MLAVVFDFPVPPRKECIEINFAIKPYPPAKNMLLSINLIFPSWG